MAGWKDHVGAMRVPQSTTMAGKSTKWALITWEQNLEIESIKKMTNIYCYMSMHPYSRRCHVQIVFRIDDE